LAFMIQTLKNLDRAASGNLSSGIAGVLKPSSVF